MTARRRIPRQAGGVYSRETDLQRDVLDLLGRAGYSWTWHDNSRRKNQAGLPDLLAVNPRTAHGLALELKRGALESEVSPAQLRTVAVWNGTVWHARIVHDQAGIQEVVTLINQATRRSA